MKLHLRWLIRNLILESQSIINIICEDRSEEKYMSKLNIDQKNIGSLFSDNKSDFTEEDIIKRNEEIISNFIKYLDDNKLIKWNQMKSKIMK